MIVWSPYFYLFISNIISFFWQAEFQNVIESVSTFGKASCISASISWNPHRGESQDSSFVFFQFRYTPTKFLQGMLHSPAFLCMLCAAVAYYVLWVQLILLILGVTFFSLSIILERCCLTFMNLMSNLNYSLEAPLIKV